MIVYEQPACFFLFYYFSFHYRENYLTRKVTRGKKCEGKCIRYSVKANDTGNNRERV